MIGAVGKARVGAINSSGIAIESKFFVLIVGALGTTDGDPVDIVPGQERIGGIFKVIQATTDTIGPYNDDEPPSTNNPPGTMRIEVTPSGSFSSLV
jgi:hypothetical protein